MTIELIKQLLDACYLAKRAREMLPALPEGVTSSYIQCLDVIQKLQTRGIQPKISDLSDALNLPRPGVTRTVKEMEHKGYLRKQVSAEDGRVTYLFLTESGQALSQKYNTDYFSQLLPYLDSISEEDAACTSAVGKKRRLDFRKCFPEQIGTFWIAKVCQSVKRVCQKVGLVYVLAVSVSENPLFMLDQHFFVDIAAVFADVHADAKIRKYEYAGIRPRTRHATTPCIPQD